MIEVEGIVIEVYVEVVSDIGVGVVLLCGVIDVVLFMVDINLLWFFEEEKVLL